MGRAAASRAEGSTDALDDLRFHRGSAYDIDLDDGMRTARRKDGRGGKLAREGIAEHHALGKELLAGFAAAEVDKHFDSGRFSHLNRDQARLQAQQQADYLWQQQHGQY